MRATITVPVGVQIGRLEQRHVIQPSPRWRGEAERDRDRILYSRAFQRLGSVTQVSASEPGHIFHTRLTHSLKVAQVARALACRLKHQAKHGPLTGTAAEAAASMDPDAAAASAMGHDLGHPPFGHTAEQSLDLKAGPAGGFEGNAQSFRILTRLALQALNPAGLNLTRQTLNGTLKYPWPRDASPPSGEKWGVYKDELEVFEWVREDSVLHEPSLVARLMDWADDLTYAVHDLDDFYRAGLIPLDRLAAGGAEVDQFRAGLLETRRAKSSTEADELLGALEDVLSRFRLRGPYSGTADERVALRSFGSRLITQYVEATSLQDPCVPRQALFLIDEPAERQVQALKALTWVYVIRRPSLAVLQHGQRRVIEALHDWYFAATEPKGDRRLLPPAYQDLLSPDATPEQRCRLVTDLVASLSEDAAVELYGRFSGTRSGSVTDAAARGA